MTKDKFLYELIDQWLNLVSCQCILMENYFQRDRTRIYDECSDALKNCLDYYDKIYDHLDKSIYPMHEVDEKLEYIIQKYKQETMKNFVKELKVQMKSFLGNIDELLDRYLYHDAKGKTQDISKEALIRFLECVRKEEQQIGG